MSEDNIHGKQITKAEAEVGLISPEEARTIIAEFRQSPEERALRAKRIQAKLGDLPPYRKEDLEKPYVGTAVERMVAAAKEARDIALHGRSVTVVDAPPRKHHLFSPSQLSSLRACPSYEGAQSETPHFRTAIGTLIHDVVESGNDNAKLSDEDANYAVYCMDFYAEQRAKMGLGVTELQEIYLEIDDYDTTAGYLDAALINAAGDEAVLMDWKTGAWPVPPAKENPQTNAYALGLFRKYPKLQSIKVFIVQPALDYVSDTVIRREDIPTHYSEIWAIVARAKAARLSGTFATARAYYPNCSFCKHVGSCPVVAKLAGEVGAKFAPLMVPADVSPSAIHDPANTKLGWQLAQVVEAWASSWRQVITNRVLCGGKPPEGYKLVSRTKREIVDAKKYREIAITRLTPEEYDATLKPSLTAVEDLISEKAPRGGKTAAVKQFSEELTAAGAVKEGEPSAFLKAVPTKPE